MSGLCLRGWIAATAIAFALTGMLDGVRAQARPAGQPAFRPSQIPAPQAPPPSVAPAFLSPAQRAIRFTDLSRTSGVRFVHVNGAGGDHFYPEQMGSGVALLDYDGDGLLDIFLVQGGPMPGFKGTDPTGNALYRNLGNGSFADVTKQAGLVDTRYGFGAAVADYDNDGHQDLYVTNIGGNALYRNNGHGRFTDVTDKAGVRVPAMSTSAAFVDYDADGWLDLFVARYMDWSLATDKRCGFVAANGVAPFGAQPRSVPIQPGSSSAYCGPSMYPPTTQRLFRNDGHGAFNDVSVAAGMGKALAHGMGAAVADFNDDGLVDIFVSADVTPNLLFFNGPGNKFREDGVLAGVAVPPVGVPRAGMGIDAGDYDNDSRMDAFITNYENEPSSLFHNRGDGTFTEDSMKSGIHFYSARFMKWGCRFVDFNLDGRQDLFVVNGHLDERAGLAPPGMNASAAVTTPREAYRQQSQLYLNDGPNHFSDVSATGGTFFQEKHVGRGAAFGDIDNDGDIDVVVTSINETPSLLRNDTPRSDRWVQLHLEGAGCNHDALGARVKVTTGVVTQTQFVRSAGSYLSDHDRRLVFGLPGFGPATAEIRWPCGGVETIDLIPGQSIKVTEKACRLPTKR